MPSLSGKAPGGWRSLAEESRNCTPFHADELSRPESCVPRIGPTDNACLQALSPKTPWFSRPPPTTWNNNSAGSRSTPTTPRTSGLNSLLGRASDREVVLTRPLRDKLIALNPGLPEAAYDDAVRQLTDAASSQSLVAVNREKYDLIRDGVPVTFRNDKGERVRERLRVFDFDQPANNDFLCVRELWVRGDLYRRRADLIGFVNGLPLLFIECKKHPPQPQGRLRGEFLRLQGHRSPSLPPQRRGDGGQRRQGEDWLHHQPLGTLPRMEAAGRGGAGRRGHGDVAQGGLRTAQLLGPRRKLHPLRRLVRRDAENSSPATTSSSASTAPSPQCASARRGKDAWASSGIPRAPARAIRW